MSAEHTDVAAYSLGLLSPSDREDFEAHLAQCPACASELAEFAAMADLFAGVDRIEAEPDRLDQPDEAAVVDLLSKHAQRVRRQSRQWLGLAVAASIVLLAGGIAAGVAAAPQRTTPQAMPQLIGTRHTATNPATGVTATVGLVSKPWGTQVTMRLAQVRGPLKCQLIAVSKTGLRRVMVGWLVPAAGYGVPAHPADLLIQGGTWISMKDLAQLQVQVLHGPTLLTIPV